MKILMTVVVAVIVVAGFSLMSAPEAEAGCAVGYGCGAVRCPLRRGPTTTGLRITTPTTLSRPMPVAVISALAIATGAGTAGTIRSAAASATKTFELPVRTG